MYADNDYGDSDISWMTDDPTPQTPAPKVQQVQDTPPVCNKKVEDTTPSWMYVDDLPTTTATQVPNNVFSSSHKLDDGEDEGEDEKPQNSGGGWSDVANSRYQGGDNPDWMNRSNNNRSINNNNRSIDHEFGDGTYRGEQEVTFDGAESLEDSGGRTDPLLGNGRGSKKGKKRRRSEEKTDGSGKDPKCGECCKSNWSFCTVILLLLCALASLGLFILSLMQEFGTTPNVAGKISPHHNETNVVPVSLRSFSSTRTSSAGTACPENKCIPAGSNQYDDCAFQYQYVTSNGKKVCGSKSCRLSDGSAPLGWSFPLAFTCEDEFPSNGMFTCGWDYMIMLWRVLSSCGGFLAAIVYLLLIKRCKSCVGCALWLINVLTIGHAAVSFICMVQDSIAVGKAQSFCESGLKVMNGVGKETVNVCSLRFKTNTKGNKIEPTCVMFQYVLVCLWDAGLGLLWSFATYAMCKSRSVRYQR